LGRTARGFSVKDRMTTSPAKAMILLLAALALAGCGVRGSLEAPTPEVPAATAEANSGQGKPEGAAPKPHKGFILDGLLR
jgi:predicted small lipoprotein YifL